MRSFGNWGIISDIPQFSGAPNDGIFTNASEVSEMCHSVLRKAACLVNLELH